MDIKVARALQISPARKLICKEHPPLALLSYCEECKKFICPKCIQNEPYTHQITFHSDLSVVIMEKITQYLCNKESQKKEQLEVFEKRNVLFGTLIQKLQNTVYSDVGDPITIAHDELKRHKTLEKINQSYTINTEEFNEISPLLTRPVENTRHKEVIEHQKRINAQVESLIEELSRFEEHAPKQDSIQVEESIVSNNTTPSSSIVEEKINNSMVCNNKPDHNHTGSIVVPEARVVSEEQKKEHNQTMEIEATNANHNRHAPPFTIVSNLHRADNQPSSEKKLAVANIITSNTKLVSPQQAISEETYLQSNGEIPQSRPTNTERKQPISSKTTPSAEKTSNDKISIEKSSTQKKAKNEAITLSTLGRIFVKIQAQNQIQENITPPKTMKEKIKAINEKPTSVEAGHEKGYPELEEERKDFPLTIPPKFNTLEGLIEEFDKIPPTNWNKLCESSRHIKRLVDELKRPHELDQNLWTKVKLIHAIGKSLNKKPGKHTTYQSLLDTESHIRELVKIDQKFSDYSKFLIQKVWIWKVILIKFSIDNKCVLDPMLSLEELQLLETRGDGYRNYGKTDEDKKRITNMTEYIANLIVHVGEKIQAIKGMKTPQELKDFHDNYEKTISFSKYLDEKKEELMKEFPLEEFNPTFQFKEEYMSQQLYDNPFDGYIPELEYSVKTINGKQMVVILD